MKVRLYDLPEAAWPPLRPNQTRDVGACSLLPPGWLAERVAIARVAPGGEFRPHRDDYHHVFWILSGEGELVLEERTVAVRAGRVAEVPAGTEHGYRNPGSEDLLLLTINARGGGREE